jgi:hypothetical protein
MTKTIEQQENGTQKITVSFLDEGIDLTGSAIVNGDVEGYVPFLVADLRRANTDLFPAPEIETMGEIE